MAGTSKISEVVAVRLPNAVRAQVADQAEQHERSLSAEVRTLLDEAIAQREAARRAGSGEADADA